MIVGLSGASAAPARSVPWIATAASTPLGSTSATRSPRRTPSSCRPAAKPAREPVELPVADLAPLGDHRHPVGVAVGGKAQVLGDRADAHAAARFRSTKPAIASIEPKFSSVISTSSIAIP